MAKPFTIDRRQLLVSGAAVTATGMMPADACAEAADTTGLAPATITESEPPAWNVCAVTARRIEEIAARNRIRMEAKLPLLSITKELRRMKHEADKAVEAMAFETFANTHRAAVWKEVLAAKRKSGRLTSWVEGVALQAQVNKLLRERFEATRQMTNKNKVFSIDVSRVSSTCPIAFGRRCSR
jgi:hypothetical protein